jgi:DNA-binding NarL/FixJ family response regulator
MSVKVLIMSDDDVRRLEVTDLLRKVQEIGHIEQARTFWRAVKIVEKLETDILVVDLGTLQGDTGAPFDRKLTQLGARWLLLIVGGDTDPLESALVLKDSELPDELVRAVRSYGRVPADVMSSEARLGRVAPQERGCVNSYRSET